MNISKYCDFYLVEKVSKKIQTQKTQKTYKVVVPYRFNFKNSKNSYLYRL